MPKQFRQVQLIVMKRKHIHLTRKDKYGHWWFEIGPPDDLSSESYGWWPEIPAGPRGAFVGVTGELNGQTNFNGLPTRDPHHGDDGDEEFFPLVPLADSRTDDEIADCLRQFAQSYRGGWRWTFGKGQNCHTFQVQAMKHCGLRKRPPKNWF
jgi:hypothetical protein